MPTISDDFGLFGQHKLNISLSRGYGNNYHGDYCDHVIADGHTTADEHEARTGRWWRKGLIDRGAYGEVWLEQKGLLLRAVKQMFKLRHGPNHPKSAETLRANTERHRRELLALTKLNQFKYFTQIYGWFEDGMKIYIVIEYVKYGDISNLFEGMIEKDAKIIIRQLVEGLKIMHDHNFAHRDLKPQNILVASLSPSIKVKISDFGTSKQVIGTDLRTDAGTWAYKAPEVDLADDNTYTLAVDMWSVGCVIYECLTGVTMFSHQGARYDYARGKGELPKEIWQLTGEQFELIVGLIKPNPKERLTAKQALDKPWLRYVKVEDNKDPDKKVGSGNCTSLYDIICEGELEALRLLYLYTEVDIACRDQGGFTPLHWAAGRGQVAMVRFLLGKEQEMKTSSLTEWKPLHAAISDGRRWTPLHSAVTEGHIEVVRLLLDNEADVRVADVAGRAPLHLAAIEGYIKVVELLMEKGAEVEVTDRDGWTPLHLATQGGHIEVAELLLGGEQRIQ